MQVDFDGKKFLPDIWHVQLKKQFLPVTHGTEETLSGHLDGLVKSKSTSSN